MPHSGGNGSETVADRTTVSSDDQKEAWYERWFDRDEYELVYRSRDDSDAERCIDLFEGATNPPSRTRVLDVACGRGRHAIVLARRGYSVTGIDLSERSIKLARQRAEREGLSARFIQADMRSATFDNDSFEAVVNLFTSFGYFDSDEDHQLAIQQMADALIPEGSLFQDYLNAEFVRNHLIEEDVRFEGPFEIIQQRWVDDRYLRKKIILDGGNDLRSFEESVRLFELEDFVRMYGEAGLQVVDVFGDYDGSRLAPSSPRLILSARKVR